MIKIIQNSKEALIVAKELSELYSLKNNFEVGLTGSFAEGTQKKASSIDFMLKLTENGNTDLVGSFMILKEVAAYMQEHYYNKYHIHWYDLLVVDEAATLKSAAKEGLEKNPSSPLVNMIALAVWVEDEFSKKEEAEEDSDEDEDEDSDSDDIIDIED